MFWLDACRRYGVMLTVDDQARRLGLLCASYEQGRTAGFVDLIVARIRASIEWITTAEHRGDPGLGVLEPSLDGMRSTIAHIESNKRQLTAAKWLPARRPPPQTQNEHTRLLVPPGITVPETQRATAVTGVIDGAGVR